MGKLQMFEKWKRKMLKNYNLKKIDELKGYGFIASKIVLLFLCFHRISLPNWNFWKDNGQYIDPKKGARITDRYILVWIIFEIIMFFSLSVVCKLVTSIFIFFLAYRILDIIQIGVNITIFKDFIIKDEDTSPMVSPHRSLIISVINYLELILCFAVIYKIFPLGYFSKINLTRVDALYFSIVTQLTIGYGDIVPNNNLIKFIIASQGILGFFFALLVVAIFINILGSIKQGGHDRSEKEKNQDSTKFT